MSSRTVKPDDLLALRFVRDGKLSPDGSLVAYAVSRTDAEANAEYCEIWIHDLAKGTRRDVAIGANFASSPCWSPDGNSLAYVVTGKEGGRVFAYSLETGESRAITPAGASITGSVSWSPDGKRLVAALTVVKPTPPVVRITERIFRHEGAGFLAGFEQSLWVFSTSGEEPIRLMSGAQYADPQWASSGDEIMVIVAGVDGPPGGGLMRLCIVNAATRQVRKFSDKWSIQAACWTPDGRVAIVGTYESPEWLATAGLWITDANDTNRECRTTDEVPHVGIRAHHDMPIWDLSMGRSAFAPTADAVYATVQVGGRAEIWKIGLSGALRCERVIGGDRSCLLLSAGARNQGLLYISSTLFDPSELCFAQWSEPSREHRLTHLNDEIVSRWPKFRIEQLEFRSEDGLRVEGWHMARSDAQGPQPTVMFIHGGPFLATGHGFRFDLVMLAANGYAVLFSNFRGSFGYGLAHTRAIHGDWGTRGFPDHMGTVDEAIRRGFADANRLGVWGQSHGGFATCWIVGHTTRFKAAVAEASVTNFATTYYLCDIPDGFSSIMGGRPDEIPDVYRSRSPITYAHRCKTPTLMLHGADDLRCTLAEAEQFYRVLRDNGCTSEMVILKGCNHMGDAMGPLTARVGQNEALLEWFERFL